MVLGVLSHVITSYASINGAVKAGLVLLIAVAVHRWAQGKKYTDDRDIHSKTYLLVGAFSGVGLRLLQELAERGAQVIALHPDPVRVAQIVELVRHSSGNERVFAEECDVHDGASIKSFAERWTKDGRRGMVQDLEARIDGIVFCDGNGSGLESTGYGISQQFSGDSNGTLKVDRYHAAYVTARHALVQSLLPVLVRSASTGSSAVRIVSQVSPFYATSTRIDLDSLDYVSKPFPVRSPWLAEGQASLAAIVWTRECQSRLANKHLLFTACCSGFTRGSISRTLRASFGHPHFSWTGWSVSWLAWPLVWTFAKGSDAGMQVLLMALLAPTSKSVVPTLDEDAKQPRLKGGALYRDGKDISALPLDKVSPDMGARLWDLESKLARQLISQSAEAKKDK